MNNKSKFKNQNVKFRYFACGKKNKDILEFKLF